MPSYIRDHFGLTQERLASWLGANRTTLASSERGRRTLPPGQAVQEARLVLATAGQVLGSTDAALPSAPPLAVPLKSQPLEARREECRYEAFRLRHRLAAMQAKATQLTARLAALPALRAYAGEVKNPAREAGWLALFEGEALDGLRDDCGPGPQRLLEARLAGLEREAELLGELLTAQTPAA